MNKTVRRLPNVKSLSSILPSGTEGGKEFSRIIDLLLFHEARRNNKKIIVFNDSAGDYKGLDSFEEGDFRMGGIIGYQYKFYASPLSNAHRENIIDSLKRAALKQDISKIKKWILITPDDLTESATKKGGGDVTWFENLRDALDLNFEIEHWGHKKLLSLFLETPSLCLFYYPELVTEGLKIRKSINEIKLKYDANLLVQNKSIEFVGMSIYKPEATKGVPLEHIYIPLKLIPDTVDEDSKSQKNINPLNLLKQGINGVVLGDPGSGKSTLLKYLSLSGISIPLQERYKTTPDDRLSILITLRRYADELKSRKNLSLIDFIKEVIQGDFSLKSADIEFLEYFLDNGKAILLFDGLDELPNSYFKEIVRDRIRSLNTSYPGNTCLISSRIVGYDSPFRFDEKQYSHFKVAKLKLPEMEQFVKDWYNVRIESEKDRDANVNDLIRILRDEDSISIRELAENPLLLTIITLVHRIDAVLPDERSVLYQKCTETLLNTWQTWKFKDVEIRNRGKVDKRNKRRMEAIAHWMHEQSTGTGKQQRSIVPYKSILNFLIEHIRVIEKFNDTDNDPEDVANDFLDFIKKRAGLLIEVGDQKFSFVHLTFQEFLTSSNIITNSEKDGLSSIWSNLRKKIQDPRWYEVIRLLVAGLKTEESQEYLICQIISENIHLSNVNIPLLLGGFLLDGVGAAETRRKEILKYIIISGSKAEVLEDIRSANSFIKKLRNKDNIYDSIIVSVFEDIFNKEPNLKFKESLILFALSSDMYVIIGHLLNPFIKQKISSIYLKLFFGNGEGKIGLNAKLDKEMKRLNKAEIFFSTNNDYHNFISAALHSINFSYNLLYGLKSVYNQFLATLATGTDNGPYLDFSYNLTNIALRNKTRDYKYFNFVPTEFNLQNKNNANDIQAYIDELILKITNRHSRKFILGKELKKMFKDEDLNFDHDIHDLSGIKLKRWQACQEIPGFYNLFLKIILKSFDLNPYALWFEALRNSYMPKVPDHLMLFNDDLFDKTEKALEKGNPTDIELMFVANHLLLDSWLCIFGCKPIINKTIIKNFLTRTVKIEFPELEIAKAIWKIICEKDYKQDLFSMAHSEKFKAIFTNSFWLPPENGKN